MGDESLILREDGNLILHFIFPVTSLTYHSNLNIILVKTDKGGIHALDVNSGGILQSTYLAADDGGVRGVEYAPGADRVFFWDSSSVGARNDYNGVLLLHTALQRPLASAYSDKKIKLELVYSEAILLCQCLESPDINSVEGIQEFLKYLKTGIELQPVRKGVKAQKWSTVIIDVPQSLARLVASGVVQELKGRNRRIPALAIASAVGQQANYLVPCSREDESRALMYSEAERKETFKRWPHMDYKWALPARMAQAGFYHQPSPSGDDRAMCFTCLVCLVCWEKSDEPWVEHERHSPNCPFVRGEYTHNVPISVTNATACAVPSPNVTIVSKGNTGDLIASGTAEGKINVWKFDCGLKSVKHIDMTPYDSIFSGVLCSDSNTVWNNILEKDSYTYTLELTAMTFVGMTSQQEAFAQAQNIETTEKERNRSKSKPSLICGVLITKTSTEQQKPIPETDDCGKALFDSGLDKSKESVKAMNDQNEAKSNLTPSNKLLFLLTYDVQNSNANSATAVVHTSNSSGNSKSGGSKKICAILRADDATYDEIYVQSIYPDDDTDLSCSNLLEEQISNVINLNASSSKDDSKMFDTKKMIFTKHFKVLPPPPPTALLPEIPDSGQTTSMLDFVGKITQLKDWASAKLDSVGTKLADQTDAAVLQQVDPITHYLNMNGPLEISDISDMKWYEDGEVAEKVKVKTFISKLTSQPTVSNACNDCFENEPPQEEVTPGIAIQCLSIPNNLNLRDDSRITHLMPTEDKEHLLVVISSLGPEIVKSAPRTAGADTDSDMDVDIVTTEEPQATPVVTPSDDSMAITDEEYADTKAYFLLYKLNTKTNNHTLNDNPVSFTELCYNESPIDLCLLPPGNKGEYSLATIGVDGKLRLYSIPEFTLLATKSVPKEQFSSVIYCTSIERLTACTKVGTIYFYALNNTDRDGIGDLDLNTFFDFYMAPYTKDKDESLDWTHAPASVVIANKTEFDNSDLQTLISLTGSYGTNTTVPYSAVVPGFWCELSRAQRSRFDHHHNNRTWRLQNTISTWDEHILELTVPHSVSLAHIEFGFTLHVPCTVNRLPVIQVTLLKQNLHGVGYKKDVAYGRHHDPPEDMAAAETDSTNAENPVNSEEYLQAHNAEILAGPFLLSSGLDMSGQAGTLILTSPRLYRAKGRTFLIHIKTLYDPAKDATKAGSIKAGENANRKCGFIGCDWLHQISITMHSNPHTKVPIERQQRIAMLESNNFLNSLLEIATSRQESEKRKMAMDLLIWVISIRLQRLRVNKTDTAKDGADTQNPTEMQQLECVNIIEKHVAALIRNCLLCAKRSIAKKCIKIITIAREGVTQLAQPERSTLERSVTGALAACLPLMGASSSPGAMRWLAALAMHAGGARPQPEPSLVEGALDLLERLARCLQGRNDVYHGLLRARFGLFGLPLERTIFDVEGPTLGKSTATPVTYASVLSCDTSNSTSTVPPKVDYQLKDLYNYVGDIDRVQPQGAWWNQHQGLGVFGAGLCEAQPLHVTCHLASDGTKLESSGARQNQAVGTSLCSDPMLQLWTAVKESQTKQMSQDPDSLEDAENSSLMDCDIQDKMELPEDNFFKDQDPCMIPWAHLVTRPPLHTLLVERMHSGARRFIVLDFGHPVRLTDLIIPCCSDLVTLGIDIWLRGEETDSVKLAFASDITTKHLVLTDIQPPPLCRFMKITTIGLYGMSAMKCKIPLGWFYGEIAELANVPASIQALNALHEDLTCRFRLATGKLIDLLNPYLYIYYGNVAHMMSYFNVATEADPKVLAAYQECIELQQQLHTVNTTLKNLQSDTECDDKLLDSIEKGELTSDMLLERASTDKLRVMCENVIDMLLYFYFQMGQCNKEMSLSWCRTVSPLLWTSAPRTAAALATLLPRLCGRAAWWGDHLADTLADAFEPHDAQPMPLDRCLVLVMYMCRTSTWSVAPALAARALSLVTNTPPQPALTAAVLAALASAGTAQRTLGPSTRWDWITGGRGGGGGAGGAGSGSDGGAGSRGFECKVHRRKLHKKLLPHQVQELDAARRSAQMDDQLRARCSNMKSRRMSMLGKAGGESCGAAGAPPLVARPLARELAQALCGYMLAADATDHADTLMLAAKVVGRLCVTSGGPGLLDAHCILGLARLAATLPPWPRHAITNLLQDLVEYETGEACSGGSPDAREAWGGGGGGASRVIRISQDDSVGFGKGRRNKTITQSVADVLADSFGINKSSSFNKPKIVAIDVKGIGSSNTMEYQLPLVAESDDSDSEDKMDQMLPETGKETIRPRACIDIGTGYISSCVDVRLESCTQAQSEVRARALLQTGAAALALGVRYPAPGPPPAPPVSPPPAPPSAAPPPPASPTAPPATAPPTAAPPAAPPGPPPLTSTLYDVFRHLGLEFKQQTECEFMENAMALWLTLNGSQWGTSNVASWNMAGFAVPGDGPRVRLASDTVDAILSSLVRLEHVTLRCWVLCLQSLAWIANLPLKTEGGPQTMGRVILDSDHFVQCIVKFVSYNVAADGAVFPSETYLSGVSIGSGAGAANALHALLTRVVAGRGGAGAGAALRCVLGVWRAGVGGGDPPAYDLHSTLLRAAHSFVPMMEPAQVPYALDLVHTIASNAYSWVSTCSPAGGGGGGGGGGALWRTGETPSEARLSGLLADVLAGGTARRVPLRRTVLAQLLHYVRAILALPLPATHVRGPPTTQSQTNTSPTSQQSQTDESKQQQQQLRFQQKHPPRTTNVEDELKQQSGRLPCVADTVMQRPYIMKRLLRALAMCDGRNTMLFSSNTNVESPHEFASLKDEMYLLVAHLAEVAAKPDLIIYSLIDYLQSEPTIQLSQSMQQLIIQLLDKPEVLATFLERGGLEIVVDKMNRFHQTQPNTCPGLVSSLMNHLKLPPQLINLSTSSASGKKNQSLTIEATNGLYNFAPLCTVSCGNPTAQAADVLLGGAGGGAAAGACAARRVRAAAWSYHFFSADDASLALTLTLPYAVQLHEIHLQPHLTSLATCPGAVAIEAGCNGPLTPLGPPQNTSGMTFIRLMVVRPIVCTNVQIRLYKPRDSSNMGLLQLRLLGAPAFGKALPGATININGWANIVSACAASPLPTERWGAVTGVAAVRTLAWLVGSGSAAAGHAHYVLLAAATACPAVRDLVVKTLLQLDTYAHAQAFQVIPGSRINMSMNGICELLRQLCRSGADGCTQAYLHWLSGGAERYLRMRAPLSAALVQTLAAILWMIKEENLLENLEQMITEELFELMYTWLRDVPENSLLKKALDAVLCSMCYIRPGLFTTLLEQMDIHTQMSTGESMEQQTDDVKVHGDGGEGGGGGVGAAGGGGAGGSDLQVWSLRGWQLFSVSAAAMSPAATLALLHSPLPAAVANTINKFSITKLQLIKDQCETEQDVPMTEKNATGDSSTRCDENVTMSIICTLVEWMRSLCIDRKLKDWLGGEGSVFWKPLLHLLCYPRAPESTWQEGTDYAQLEESTIRLFAELTACHSENQKLFASTLHTILESTHCSDSISGISGFARALILRLVLSCEHAVVALRWAGGAAAGAPLPGSHPAHHCHAMVALPTATTVRALLAEKRPPLPSMDETGKPCASAASGSGAGGGWPRRRASDTALMTVAETWELSLAAASASKDKRVKDAKNNNIKQLNKQKRHARNASDAVDAAALAVADELEPAVNVRVAGVEGVVGGAVTLAQLSAAVPHVFGPHLTLTLHLASNNNNTNNGNEPSATWEGGGGAESNGCAVLRAFGACGGLALVAARLPRPHAAPPPQPAPHHIHFDFDWVKLDDAYEEVMELGSGGGGGGGGEEGAGAACGGVPPHALLALALLLKVPGYPAALLDEGARAVHLLRLLLGVTHDEEGRSISVGGGSWSLGTLPFRVVSRLLEGAPCDTDDGRVLRRLLLAGGAVRLLLACLAVFTHHKPASSENSQASNGSSLSKAEEKSQLYWAKGTGFGTGSTQQSWNVEQALVRQRTEEEHVTVLLQVLASYMHPCEKWPPEECMESEGEAPVAAAEGAPGEEDAHDLPAEFVELIVGSSLVPAICSYLRNDSVLDMSRHIPLYLCVLSCTRAMFSLRSRRLAASLAPLPRLLRQMSATTNSYATKLRMSKKDIFKLYHKKYTMMSNPEPHEEDEGLATLIADIQTTSTLLSQFAGDEDALSCVPRPMTAASREARYIEVMRMLQFETFELMEACPENGYRFTVPYYFEGPVRVAGERSHPARMKRLAQEAATLASSLPLSYSSSVFVRTDTDRLDIMKVLITGPSDTPYANGCFVLDVYFPAEYPAVPMMINLATTGRHSVRFNPNLYNDGKVCLSVLNTWHGRPEEKWNAHTSSFLQVLVSIQSLILVPEPYFNEPGYERSRGTRAGNNASTEYNSNIYQANVRWAMLDHLRNPEPCFKEVIQTHFWIKRNEIMQTISGWITELEGQSADERTQRTIQLNLMALKRHYVKIQEELANLPVPAGLEDLDEPFQLPAVPSSPSPPAPPTAPALPCVPPDPVATPALAALAAFAPLAPHAAQSPPDDDDDHDHIDHDMEKFVSEMLE